MVHFVNMALQKRRGFVIQAISGEDETQFVESEETDREEVEREREGERERDLTCVP